MKLPTKLIVLTVLFIGFSSFNLLAKVKVGEPLPQFELPRVENTVRVNTKSLLGKVVYVDFWASWCKPCIESFPRLNTLYNEYNQQGFEILAVNLDQRKQLASDFLEKYPVDYINTYDENMKVGRIFNVSVMPVGYLIDRKGIVRAIHHGFKPGDEIKMAKAIKILLKDKNVNSDS